MARSSSLGPLVVSVCHFTITFSIGTTHNLFGFSSVFFALGSCFDSLSLRSVDCREFKFNTDDRELKGRQIFLREDKEGGKGPGSKGKGKGKPLSDDQAQRQVFVGNMSWKTTWKGANYD